MSKSKGNVVTPIPLLEKYTSDGVRYWSARAKLGADTAFEESVMQVGKKLVTKLFNAAKFILSQELYGEKVEITEELDRAFIETLWSNVQSATEFMEKDTFSKSLAQTEAFFWSGLTDNYIELVR